MTAIYYQHSDSDSKPGRQLHSRSSPGERNCKFSQNGKFSENGKFGQNGKLGHSSFMYILT